MKRFLLVDDETCLILQHEYIALISSVGLPLAYAIQTNRCKIEGRQKTNLL